MSGIQGQVFGHLARRGMEYASNSFAAQNPAYVAQLHQDAQAYEQAGPEMEVKPWEMLPVVITGAIFLLLLASIRYTVGEVVATLAMIESPSSMAIIEPKSSLEPDAPLEKEPLMDDTDVEVTIIHQKPITAKIRATIRHLHSIGGFRARWRGVGLSVLYHFLHSVAVNIIVSFAGFNLIARSVAYIFVSVALSRIHMAWTHAMIAQPSTQPWYKRLPSRKSSKALLLPALVFATAQQATFLLPAAVAVFLGMHKTNADDFTIQMMQPDGRHQKMACLGMLKFIAVPATALLVALLILLPASVTLTRIEASLLPDDQDTIVPFDRTFNGALSPIQLSEDGKMERGASKSLFVEAWRSFDRAARLRLIKLYVKMVMIQIVVVVVGLQVMVAEVYLIGGERLAVLFKAGKAQLELMAIEAKEKSQ